MDNKKKVKFNIIDVIVLVLIVCAGIFVVRTFSDGGLSAATGTELVNITFYEEEVPEYVTNYTAVGDEMFDKDQSVSLGTITQVITDDSQSYAADENGVVTQAPKDGYKSIYITSQVMATVTDHGVIIDGVQYTIGHSVVVYAGDGKYYGRIYDFTKAE